MSIAPESADGSPAGSAAARISAADIELPPSRSVDITAWMLRVASEASAAAAEGLTVGTLVEARVAP